MKANEAPEKIYLFRNPITEEPDDRWLSNRSCDDDIEYTRTDAFIEKACKWFREIDYDDSKPPFETTEEFIKGFKNYMKGE